MKKLFLIFTILLIILSWCSYKETKKVKEPLHSFLLIQKKSSEKFFTLSNSVVTSDTKEIGYIQRKKITKGIKQTFPVFSNETCFQLAAVENRTILTPISFLNSNTFFENRKRGPPFI